VQRQTIDLAPKADNTPEEIFKNLEKEINTLVEESSLCATQKDFQGALEKAKEAAIKEKQLTKQKE